jgi:8-oxo-dGTP pyrophosphatase MutT (NUDIX family)
LLVVDAQGRVLLLRFAYPYDGPLKGWSFWATPGGEREAGETFEVCAIRELREETGIERTDVGPQVARRQFSLKLHDGEEVMADERYYRIDVANAAISHASWTELERQVMHEHRWWTRDELLATTERVFPEGLVELLNSTAATLR